MSQVTVEIPGSLTVGRVVALSGPQSDEPKRVFESGAVRSSKLPRYDLIPREVLNCLADRLKLGAAKYGEWNWQKGIADEEFLKDTLNHMQGHLSNVMAGDFSEDDEYGNIGGILFGCMVRLAALKAKKV